MVDEKCSDFILKKVCSRNIGESSIARLHSPRNSVHYIIATMHLNSTEKFIFIVLAVVDALWSAIDFEIAAVKITRRLFENRAP